MKPGPYEIKCDKNPSREPSLLYQQPFIVEAKNALPKLIIQLYLYQLLSTGPVRAKFYK